MERTYLTLRAELMKKGIDQAYLCKLLKKSQTYITQRITAKRSWTLDDAYRLLDIINKPYEELHIYFPKRKGVKE